MPTLEITPTPPPISESEPNPIPETIIYSDQEMTSDSGN